MDPADGSHLRADAQYRSGGDTASGGAGGARGAGQTSLGEDELYAAFAKYLCDPRAEQSQAVDQASRLPQLWMSLLSTPAAAALAPPTP